jgi:hypothetical protein
MNGTTPAPVASEGTCDAIVIGSSPLMLLVALEERAAGKAVCVVDKTDALGGVWRTVRVGESLAVEYACHLVEDFPGVYDYLGRAAGVEFAALDEQPVRVLRNGTRVRYSSRTTLVLATAWAVGLVARHWCGTWFAPASEAERERLVVLRQKVRDFFVHHRGLLVRGSTVKGPVGGYAEFIRALTARCERAGIVFRRFDVTAAAQRGGAWRLRDGEGRELSATEIHATTSATLTKGGGNEFAAHATHETVTRSVLVEVPLAQVKTRVSYAAFWQDTEVVRVSRVDQPRERAGGLLYLVQLGKDGPADGGLAAAVQRSLQRCGVLGPGGAATIVDEIRCTRVPHERQLPAGLIAPNFRTYSSAGNLASGVAHWLASRRSPSRL